MREISGSGSGDFYQRQQLLEVYDDFVEFNACCAFFFDAVAAVEAGKAEALDEASVEGLRIQAQWLKERSGKLKEALAAVWGATNH